MNRKLKIAAKYILHYSPHFLKERISSYKNKIELKEALARANRTKVTKAYINDLLDKIQIEGDVMLHTSMLNIGKVEGGRKFISQAIINKIDTQKHTLLISALPYRGAFINYLKTDPVFDVRTAPIAMGAVNEYIAQHYSCERSIHPTHSVIAIGPKAHEYTCEHHLDATPFGNHSPYYKLFRNHGSVLFFGATLHNFTCIHVIEDLLGDSFPVKVYDSHNFTVHCKDRNGKSLSVQTTCHDALKGIIRDASFMHDDLIQNGVMKSFPLGEAEMLLLDCTKFLAYYLNLLENGHSIYGRHKVTPKLRNNIEKIRKEFNLAE